MTITSEQVPKPGSVSQALKAAEEERASLSQVDPSSGQDITQATTRDLDEQREGLRRETTYTVLAGPSEHGPFAVEGVFVVVGGQAGARRAAVDANSELKQRILNGDPVWLAAISSFNVIQSEVENRDPEIKV